MIIHGLQISDKEIRYVFPKDIQSITQFVRVIEIKKKLKQTFQDFVNFLPNFPYRSRYPSSGNKIIFQCSFCPNRLLYEVNRQKGIYELKSFCVDHIHGINFDNQEIRNNEPIKEYSIHTERINEIIQRKVDSLKQPLAGFFSDPKKKQKLRQPTNFQDLITILREQNYFLVYEPENYKEIQLGYPDFLLIISQDMKKTYINYARCIGFDFTFSLIKQAPLTKYGKREYMIGLIAGLNSYRRIGIYALVVAVQESKYVVEKAFTQFLRYMQMQPQSIVTDQSLGMLAGTKSIKDKGIYNGQSYWDTFHVLKTYKFRNKQLKAHMRKMIRVKCKFQFHKMYLQAVLIARTQEEMDAVHKFMHQSHKYCISQIQPAFIGLGVSDSQNQMVNNLIKNQIPHQSRYFKVVHRILIFIERRNLLTQMMARETCRVQQVVNSRQLHIVRYSLCRIVYSFLFIQICKCCKVDLAYRGNDEYNFYCVQDSNTVHYVEKLSIEQCKHLCKVRVPHIKDAFKCTCTFQQKTGVPCQHILKVIFQTDNNFIDRIDQYWVVQQPEKLFKCVSNSGTENEQKVKKRGRPLGKPTMFYKPLQSTTSEMKLPQGISTFEPVKPKPQSSFGENSNKKKQGQDYKKSGKRKNSSKKKVDNQSREEMIKNFYANNAV